MKTFASITDAFDWWIKTIYPTLPADEKKGRLTNAWRNYTHNLGISEAKMHDILKDYGSLSVKTLVTFEPSK